MFATYCTMHIQICKLAIDKFSVCNYIIFLLFTLYQFGYNLFFSFSSSCNIMLASSLIILNVHVQMLYITS